MDLWDGFWGFSGMIIGYLLNHFLARRNQRQEQKMKFRSVIEEDIANSLQRARLVEQELYKTRILGEYDGPIKDGEFYPFMDNHRVLYPSVMENMDSLINFYKSVSQIRQNDEINLNLKTAAYFEYMQNYLKQLIEYIRVYHLQDKTRLLGACIMPDFRYWQRLVDHEIVKIINKSTWKLESKFRQNGKKWKYLRNQKRKMLWDNKSVLYKLIYQTEDDKIKEMVELLFDSPVEIDAP